MQKDNSGITVRWIWTLEGVLSLSQQWGIGQILNLALPEVYWPPKNELQSHVGLLQNDDIGDHGNTEMWFLSLHQYVFNASEKEQT